MNNPEMIHEGRRREVPSTTGQSAASRVWHLFVALDVSVALTIQAALIATGGPDPNTGDTVASVGVVTRTVQTLSFFTIQSNLIVLAVAVSLALEPRRDGRLWRVARLDALLGITITGLVFDLVLIHYVHPTGWQLVATIGLHYVAPWATVLGWWLFGPRPRIDRATVVWAFVWPVSWIVYTFVRGAIVGWYPYPFLDVTDVGYPRAAAAAGTVLLLGVALAALAATFDRRRLRSGRPRQLTHRPRTPR